MNFRKFITFAVFLIIATAIFVVPSFAAEKTDDAGTKWNIYFRPGVRFGTESRVLYILDFLIPLYQDEKNIFFSNIKYTPNDHDGWELNAGMGYRRLLWDEKLLLGLNAYYDKRKTDWGTNHEQWGVGLEAMADIPLEAFDLGLTGRFNYYYPLSHTRIDGLGTPYASYMLSDSGIILTGGRVEEPMRGFDYELGMRIPYISDYVETWAYAGGYHYKGRRVRDINGFAARLEVIPTDFMRLNYEFHYDNYSREEHYGEVTFEVPFSMGNLVTGKNPFEGIGDVFNGSRELKARMVEPTRRDVDVKVIIDNDNENIPGGGEEIEDVVFVSETGIDAPGNGTKEHPYREIGYAMNNDPRILSGACRTIHVMNSDPTSPAGGGIVNREGMLIWGSGVNHPDYPVSNMPYSGYPTVRPPGGTNYVLTLARPNIMVTGLEINKTGGTASGGGIRINNVGSGVRIIKNIFNIDRPGDVSGIYSSIAGPMGTETNPIVIANNTFSVNSGGGNASGIYLDTPNDIFTKIIGNDMSNTITGPTGALGILLYSTGGGIGSDTSPAVIYGNPITVTASNGEAYGIALDADSDVFAHIIGNDMSNTITGHFSADGIYVYSDSGSIGSATRPVIISGNPMTVTANIGDACGISLDAEKDIFAAVVGNDMSNTITGNMSAYGIWLYSNSGNVGSATRPVTIFSNPMTVTANTYDAGGISLYGDSDVFAYVIGNDLSNTITGGEYAAGIYLHADGGNMGSETRPVIVSSNPMTVTANTYNAAGIVIEALNDVFATVTGNDLSNTITGEEYADGIYIYSPTGSIGSETRPVIISGNPMTVTANDYAAYGISLEADDDVFAKIVGNDIFIDGQGDPSGMYPISGIFLYSNIGGIGSETRPVIISGNPMSVTANIDEAYGIYFEAQGNIFATISANDMSNTIEGGEYADGIWMRSWSGNLGSETRPVIISGNPMTVTANTYDASGIDLSAFNDIFAKIIGNDLSIWAPGDYVTAGIYLYTPTGNIGSDTRPVLISSNPMTVTVNTYNAYGIYLDADLDIFANVKRNYMNIVSTSAEAYGGYMEAGNLIGDVTSLVTYFYKNYGTINGSMGRYLLYLTGNSGGGNYVNWAGNKFTPVGGAWSGSYGPNNEVEHNFTIPPDVLKP